MICLPSSPPFVASDQSLLCCVRSPVNNNYSDDLLVGAVTIVTEFPQEDLLLICGVYCSLLHKHHRVSIIMMTIMSTPFLGFHQLVFLTLDVSEQHHVGHNPDRKQVASEERKLVYDLTSHSSAVLPLVDSQTRALSY